MIAFGSFLQLGGHKTKPSEPCGVKSSVNHSTFSQKLSCVSRQPKLTVMLPKQVAQFVLIGLLPFQNFRDKERGEK